MDPILAIQAYTTCEPIRKVCQSAFGEWQALIMNRLLDVGYSEKQSKDFSIIVNALIEGGILMSQTLGNGTHLIIIAEQIPLLLKKNG